MRDDEEFEQGFDDGEYTEHTAAVGFVPLEILEPQKRIAAFIVLSGRSFGKSYTLESDDALIGRAP